MIIAKIEGNPCLKRMLFDERTAPKIAAIITHARKNIWTLNDHSALVMKNDQISPAARNPLYKP